MKDIFDIFNRTSLDLSKYYEDFKNIFFEVKKILKISQTLELALSIVLPDEQIKLNKQYRHKDYVADVLTFPLSLKNLEDNFLDDYILYKPLGDIFICYDQAVKQATLYEHSLRRELSFLFVHGMLHILGFDHQNKKEEIIMFDLQEKILNNLQIYRNQLK